MIKNKEQYCSPTTNILVVRFEGVLMTSDIIESNGTQRSRVVSGIDSGFDGWEELD